MVSAIKVSDISKTYRLYQKPGDRLKELVFRKKYHQQFQSLKEISFELNSGEAVGIIGRNGAGKSTLLKILAGTITQSTGTVETNGRIAALLELGAGFHPEFTGRENIYLNASLIGLSSAEIADKENEIIEFADLGSFMEQPIKTYSSGMAVRLAFSIATAVDPDILIIDEALSVGDQHFQKKCIDKILDFKRRKKTLLFCSHALYLVNLLCGRTIWIDQGTIRMDGSAARVTAAYEDTLRNREVEEAGATPINTPVYINAIELNGQTDPVSLEFRDDLMVTIHYESKSEVPFWLAVGIRRNDDLICHAVSMSKDLPAPITHSGKGKISLYYYSLPFLHGTFSIVGSVLDESGLHCYHQKESPPVVILQSHSYQYEIGLLELDYEWRDIPV